MKAMRAFFPLVVGAGIIQFLIPSTLHNIIQEFHLGEGEGGLLPLVYFAGIMLGCVLITRLLQKLSVKTLVISGATLVSASLIATSLSQWFALFIPLLFLAGFGNGALIILPGLYATNVLREKSAGAQSALFVFLSLGTILGPLLPGLIEHLQISWRWTFAFPGLLVLLLVIPVAITRLEHMGRVEMLSFRFVREMVSFDRRFFIGLVAALTLAGGGAQGISMWLVTFLENARGLILGSAHLVLCGFAAGMLLGRLACGYVTTKGFSVYKTLLIITSGSAVLVLLAPLSPDATVDTVLFPVAALFLAGIAPLLLSAAAVYPKSESPSAYSLLYIAMAIGGAIIPYAVGHAFELVGTVAAMSSISVLLLGLLGCLLFIRRELPIREHAYYRAFAG